MVLCRCKCRGCIRRTKKPQVSRWSGLQEETVSGIKSWIQHLLSLLSDSKAHLSVVWMTGGSGWVCVLPLSGTCWKHISEERCARRDRTMLLSSGGKRRGSKSLRETGKYIKSLIPTFVYPLADLLCFIYRGQKYPTPVTSPASFSWNWVFMITTGSWQTASPACSSCAAFIRIIHGTGWIWPWASRDSWSLIVVLRDPALRKNTKSSRGQITF